MGGFTFAPRRRAYGTFWQIAIGVIFRVLKKIFKINLIDTNIVTVDMITTSTQTINMINTDIVELEMESC